MVHAKPTAMKSLFAAFRPITAGQSLVQRVGPVNEPSHDDQQGDIDEKSADQPNSAEAIERAPYPTRLRMLLVLALLSWLLIAFIAWAIMQF